MLRKWLGTIRIKWQQVAGGMAVALMFFVPITRAVLAGKSDDKNKGKVEANKPNTGAKKSNTKPPKTPSNPSPKSTGRRGSGGDNKPHGK